MATTKELERRGYKIVNAKLKSAGFHDLNGVVVVPCELEFAEGETHFTREERRTFMKHRNQVTEGNK